MAQIGSFIPAKAAKLGIVDRIFTRIGAGDDLASGQSTFYLEMAEAANILRRCTRRSLLLIDEVGRGTGTIDGLAIAQAICEYLNEQQTLPSRKIIAGFDSRFMGEKFAAETAAIFSANNFDVLLCQSPTPTPVISHAIRHNKAAGGVNFGGVGSKWLDAAEYSQAISHTRNSDQCAAQFSNRRCLAAGD